MVVYRRIFVMSEEEYGNIYDQQKSETSSKLVEWAIDHNVPNNTFSELLKISKEHVCFSNFPADASRLYQTHSNISYDLPVQVKTVPPVADLDAGDSSSINVLDPVFSHEGDEQLEQTIDIGGQSIIDKELLALITLIDSSVEVKTYFKLNKIISTHDTNLTGTDDPDESDEPDEPENVEKDETSFYIVL
ncbi:hypothetical protein QTP88_005677 [Uroleucon formosanum]